MTPAFCVVGSINMDLVTQVDRFPRPGETRTGTKFGTYPGGKGANQAVALARLGGNTRMAGKIGDDVFGADYMATFRDEGIDTSIVETVGGTSTGVAVIEVDSGGENHIIIVPGANGLVDGSYIDANVEQIVEAGYILFQLETPFETVAYAMRQASSRGCRTILDPAPAPPHGLSQDMLSQVDYLTPNESEAEALTGIAVADLDSAAAAGNELRTRTAAGIVIKAGGHGAYIIDDDGARHVSGYSVDIADTTAAGDAFNAGLAFALGHGRSLDDAVGFANAVGAMSCTGFGAQSAMPTYSAAEGLINE